MNQAETRYLQRQLRGLARRQMLPHALNASTPWLAPAGLAGAALGLVWALSDGISLLLVPAGALVVSLIVLASRLLLASLRARRPEALLALLKEADRGAHAEDVLLTAWQQRDGAFASLVVREAEAYTRLAIRSPRKRLRSQPFIAWASVLVLTLAIGITPLVLDAVQQSPSDKGSPLVADEDQEGLPPLPSEGQLTNKGDLPGGESLAPSVDSEAQHAGASESDTAPGEGAGGSGDSPLEGEGAGSKGDTSDQPAIESEGEGQAAGASKGEQSEAKVDREQVRGASADNATDKPTPDDPASEQDDYLRRPPRKETGISKPGEREREERDLKTREEVKRFDPWADRLGERTLAKRQRDVYDPEAEGDNDQPKLVPKGVPKSAATPERRPSGSAAMNESERDWAKSWAERARSR